MAAASLRSRLDRLAWPAVEAELEKQPYARLGRLLTTAECRQLTSLFTNEACFRSRIDMERHRFGVGEYKYFANPLPPLVEDLRSAAYPHLASVANGWAEGLGTPQHQDLYGEVAIPLQVAVFLSRPGRDYTGGEFLLVEQRPRAQSVGEALLLGEGEAVVFANRHRPVRSTRGFYRAAVRHGVSRVRSGRRFTLGVIFHDAL